MFCVMRADLAYIQRKAKLLFASSKRPSNLPFLFLLTDSARGFSPEPALGSAPKGAVVILRTFGDAELIAKIAPKARIKVGATVAPHIARKYQLHGVHIPNRRLKYYKKSEPCPKLLTASAHNLHELLRAKRAGITNILISAIFASDSKSANERPIGPIRLAKLARDFPEMNLIALGGISRKTLPHLKNTNARAVAGVSFERLKSKC